MIILIGFSGCMEKDRSHLAKQRIESVLETEGERSLDFARSFMAKGLYKESLERSESVLKQYPRSLGDQALLNLGLVYADPGYAEADVQKSIKYFERLIEVYPESILKVEAEI
jgi:tetratricopeptide (TPR) repeat protein